VVVVGAVVVALLVGAFYFLRSRARM
jgi:hypothetical protein